MVHEGNKVKIDLYISELFLLVWQINYQTFLFRWKLTKKGGNWFHISFLDNNEQSLYFVQEISYYHSMHIRNDMFILNFPLFKWVLLVQHYKNSVKNETDSIRYNWDRAIYIILLKIEQNKNHYSVRNI